MCINLNINIICSQSNIYNSPINLIFDTDHIFVKVFAFEKRMKKQKEEVLDVHVARAISLAIISIVSIASELTISVTKYQHNSLVKTINRTENREHRKQLWVTDLLMTLSSFAFRDVICLVNMFWCASHDGLRSIEQKRIGFLSGPKDFECYS